MYINRDDKGIFLMILAIVIVSVIAVVAVLGIIWSIISPGVNQIANAISNTIKTSNIDYNFYVPPREDTQVNEEPAQQPEEPGVVVTDKDYNFETPAFPFPVIEGQKNYFEVVREDVKAISNIFQPKLGESPRVQIEKIQLDSPIIEEGEGEKAMNSGFWVYTNLDNKKFPDTGILLTCNRRYFDSNDPRSCYYLHYLYLKDEIKIVSDGNEYIYSITGFNEFDSEVGDIYSEKVEQGKLKLISSSLDGKSRYVIVAEMK